MDMDIEKVLVASKKTAFEHYREEGMEDLDMESLGDVKERYRSHRETEREVERLLEDLPMDYRLEKIPLKPDGVENVDLVVSVGGDGTALKVASKVGGDTWFLPVRSSCRSYGSLCTCGSGDLDCVLEALDREDYRIEEWSRAKGEVGENKGLALNEIFVGAEMSMKAAEYVIRRGEEEERHMNSGLVVSTGAGSTGWYSNINGGMEPFDAERDELRYVEREAIRDEDRDLKQGVVYEGEPLEIKSLMDGDGIVSFDGSAERSYGFRRGREVEIKLSENPLNVVIPEV